MYIHGEGGVCSSFIHKMCWCKYHLLVAADGAISVILELLLWRRGLLRSYLLSIIISGPRKFNINPQLHSQENLLCLTAFREVSEHYATCIFISGEKNNKPKWTTLADCTLSLCSRTLCSPVIMKQKTKAMFSKLQGFKDLNQKYPNLLVLIYK